MFSRSVVSDSLWPHGLQHARLPCPSLSPGACSNWCALSQWCRPTNSSSVTSFSSCLQSFPASRPFPVSRLLASGGLSTGTWVSTWVLPMNVQAWFPLLIGLIALQSKGLSRVFSSTTVRKHQFFSTQPCGPTLTSIHDSWKNHSFDYMDLYLQSEVSVFLTRCLGLLQISSNKQVSFTFMAAVTICSDFGAQEKKVSHCFHCFPIYFPRSNGPGCLSFLNVEL